MHIYKCIQSHINLHHHISVIPVTVIMVSCNKHKTNIQIIVHRYITPLDVKSSVFLPHTTYKLVEKNGHIYKCVFVDLSITKLLYMTLGYRGSTVVKVVAGSIPASVTGFFIDIKSFRSHYGPGVDSASNRNEYQDYFLVVKAAGA